MSNYHSIVKMCLLEKRIPFEEVHEDIALVAAMSDGSDPSVQARLSEYLRKSPLGKVPCIGTAHGYLSETQVILDYLEEAYPEVSLLPRDAFARAKVRELVRVLDLHVELVARRLYGQVFFGGEVDSSTKAEIHARLMKGLAGVSGLTTLSPYACGDTFTLVDCVAAIHLPVVGAVLAKVYGDALQQWLPNVWSYVARIAARPSYVAATRSLRGRLTGMEFPGFATDAGQVV